MIIKCYRSAKFEKTITYQTDRIIAQLDTEDANEIDPDATPLLNMHVEGIGWIGVPIQFVISIHD